MEPQPLPQIRRKELRQVSWYPQRSTTVAMSGSSLFQNDATRDPDSYLCQVLALELRDQLLQPLIVRFDANRFENAFNVGSGWGGVATKTQEKVCCEMLHFAGSCNLELIAVPRSFQASQNSETVQ